MSLRFWRVRHKQEETPSSADDMADFSLHPDGKRFLTSIAKWPFDIWTLEGLVQHNPWLDRLLRR